ncbi:MAG: isoaspartyl peptidase/L-asparaginase [Flavobacteriales bacterium]|jgi:L-asparaginase / beta-aspartyl-peptidase|nr:beta-aspartyl-peptidase [Flavobacteriaceae bacterium]RZP08477.1 MAG: isoaspartyl peptidase/L-asparaginase [Flavobacteriales bacterium]
MKYIYLLIFFVIGCSNSNNLDNNFGIVIHGGAGTILKENMTLELEEKYKNALREAVLIGYDILNNGGTSEKAVEKTINYLEDSPLFNAGKGAVLNFDGEVELDASFMEGKNLNAGAISGSKKIKNPISTAIKVMNSSSHVMLSGKGADDFAIQHNMQTVEQNYFKTERRINSLKKIKSIENNKVSNLLNSDYRVQKLGTVGCVALDKFGNLSAGTSTGGMTNKKWNRIGDAPIIGAGTYANNNSCAVSSTGWGEYFIRGVVAYDIAALMEYKNLSIKKAAKTVINKISKMGGDGGVIAIDKQGNIAMEMNTSGMYRAHINSKGEIDVKIYK